MDSRNDAGKACEAAKTAKMEKPQTPVSREQGAEASSTSDGLALRLKSHVEQLAGEIGERNVFRPGTLRAAAEYIEDEWRRQDYTVARQEYEARGERCVNLEVVRRGSNWPNRILLIGAHYDSIRGSPGANDNASGVAALLEISRLFAAVTPALTVKFVAFVNEEWPFFYRSKQGSAVYAKAARKRGDDIRAMVAMDSIGFYLDVCGSQKYPPLFRYFFPDRGNFIGFVSDFDSRRIMERADSAFDATSDFPHEHVAAFRFIPGISWSDHLSFWHKGYPALMVTDTALFRYRHYHTVEDTPDKLTYPAFARATQGLHDCFLHLAIEGVDESDS